MPRPEGEPARILHQLDTRLQTLGFTHTSHENTLRQVEAFTKRITSSFHPDQQRKIFNALGLSLEVHKDQDPRPDGTPYVDHPLDVATKVFDHMAAKDAAIVIAALLHDSVEDQARKINRYATPSLIQTNETETALAVIEDSYGSRVTRIVRALSNPDFDTILTSEGVFPPRIPVLPAHDSHLKRRNELYKEHLAEAIEDADVVLIKYFDFASNGLRLDEVTDDRMRSRLLRRYAPVVQIFIDRLQRTDDPINVTPEYKGKMLAALQRGKEAMSRMFALENN